MSPYLYISKYRIKRYGSPASRRYNPPMSGPAQLLTGPAIFKPSGPAILYDGLA